MGKLQINGDLLLAGNLMMSTSNVSAYSVISVKADSNGYGQNLLIGAGGNTVIGGGESALTFFTASGIKDEENLYLTADGSIHVYTNCDTIANRKLVMSMGADGNITTSGNLTMTETKNILLRPNNSNYTAGIGYDTNGNECIALWAKNTVTRLRWYAGTDMTNMAAGTMMGITPDFEISKASGTAIGYISGNTILHSNNYTSYTVTKTGSGASGTWGISITGNASYASSAGHATYLNTVAGNEIRIHNATGLTNGGSLWLGWAWADGSKTVTKDWYIGNFSGGGLANIYASTFNGTLNGNASSANWASGASYSNGLASTGFGDNNFTYFQTSGDFYGTTDWAHYLIANHGSGATYYNYVLRLPFWGPPQYKRQTGNTSATEGWYTFLSTENYSSYALPLSGGTMTGKLQVNNIIFSYNYSNNNNAPAFVWDKPGSYFTGIGASGTDTIKFGPVESNGTFSWVSGFAQHWVFQGTIRPGCIILTNDQWTGYGTADPNDLGLDKVVGRVYFKI